MLGRGWVVAGTLTYALVGAAVSAQAREPSRKAPLREVAAKVLEVDVPGGRVALELPEGEIRVFRVDDETVFFLPGRQVLLSDLRPGQAVRAVFERGADEPLLEWVEVERPAGGALPGSAR